MTIEPPSESTTFTLVVHLPQSMTKFSKLLTAISALWPDAKFSGDFSRLEIKADDPPAPSATG